ncbi:MAG TPA: twin-arginine translocation signal domain-containing protein [Nitrososphaerales archaeon]|nr:twin-arginine translocation signal domain-containing protein [Nitrososphaerales archaeon]
MSRDEKVEAHDEHKDEEQSSRRNFLKWSLGVGLALMVAGIAAVTKSLWTPGVGSSGSATGGTGFPRFKVANISSLQLSAPLIFNYPLDDQPNVLVKIGERAAGGVGPGGDIIAFSIVCQHLGCVVGFQPQGASPSCNPSFRAPGPVGYCCCHGSAYDFANGAKVVGGPSPRPLPQVILHVDEPTGDIYAVGMGPPTVFGFNTGSSDVSHDLQGGSPVS